MGNNVDDRVVKMGFDNRQFAPNIVTGKQIGRAHV